MHILASHFCIRQSIEFEKWIHTIEWRKKNKLELAKRVKRQRKMRAPYKRREWATQLIEDHFIKIDFTIAAYRIIIVEFVLSLLFSINKRSRDACKNNKSNTHADGKRVRGLVFISLNAWAAIHAFFHSTYDFSSSTLCLRFGLFA